MAEADLVDIEVCDDAAFPGGDEDAGRGACRSNVHPLGVQCLPDVVENDQTGPVGENRTQVLLAFLSGYDVERRAEPGGQGSLEGGRLGLCPGVVLADGNPEDSIHETP